MENVVLLRALLIGLKHLGDALDRHFELFAEADSLGALAAALPGGALIARMREDLLSHDVLDRVGEDVDRWERLGIEVIVRGGPYYPPQLQSIDCAPAILFVKGNRHALLHARGVAVVGSRAADAEGLELARGFSEKLVRGGALVVSGLALGIDGAAHRGALAAGRAMATAAVLGNGLARTYPSSHARLAAQIVENGGALVSQFLPDCPPYPSNFLNRNRVISGLARAALIVQASERSGSLVTGRYALEQGRELLVVPGGAGDPRYAGSNRLIKQGAYLVDCIDDVWDLLPEVKSEQVGAEVELPDGSGELTPAMRKVVAVLKQSRQTHIDQLAAVVRERDLTEILLHLELQDMVKRLPGNYYAARGQR